MSNNFYREITEEDFRDPYASLEPGLSPADEEWAARINARIREHHMLKLYLDL